MTRVTIPIFMFAAVAASSLSGCGTSIPEITEVWDRTDPNATYKMEYLVKRAIYCELLDSIHYEDGPGTESAKDNGKLKKSPNPILPTDWGAQITLSFEVDETGAVNPGLALNTPMHSGVTSFIGQPPVTSQQSYAFGLGGTLSSQSTRTDKYTYSYSISDLLKEDKEIKICQSKESGAQTRSSSSPLSVISDLGLKKWIKDAVEIDKQFTSTPGFKISGAPAAGTGASIAGAAAVGTGGGKTDSFSIEIKFTIISSANATPTWKLVRVSANSGNSPLFSLNRTRIHDLNITIGPPDTSNGANGKGGLSSPHAFVLNQTGQASHNASQNGLAVSSTFNALLSH